MKRILQKQSKDSNDTILKELEQVQDDIDYLYSIIQPEAPALISLDQYDYGITIRISEDIYNEIVKYIENKDNLFIGIT